jgi:two-component system, sensor histidine kinase and response regulator
MSVKILIVEDDFANQRVASLFLKKLGYESDVAVHGAQALELIQKNPYQLVLMDCQMPVMDGFEATSKIRQLKDCNQDVPIIALTANVICGVNGDCIEAGMNDVLNKPIQLDKMRQMIDTWLNKEAAK